MPCEQLTAKEVITPEKFTVCSSFHQVIVIEDILGTGGQATVYKGLFVELSFNAEIDQIQFSLIFLFKYNLERNYFWCE